MQAMKHILHDFKFFVWECNVNQSQYYGKYEGITPKWRENKWVILCLDHVDHLKSKKK